MRFLADMGVSRRVVDWLRQQGHDAIHLRDQGLQRLPNGEIFSKAITEERIVLTFDLDFGEIVALCQGRPASVVLFRLNNTKSDFTIRRLEMVLQDAAESLEAGAVVVVEDWRHRTRHLPLGT
jgi:predicted nuclease of predicted toxin-antitoxin system